MFLFIFSNPLSYSHIAVCARTVFLEVKCDLGFLFLPILVSYPYPKDTGFSKKPDGTLLKTYGKADGIKLGEMQRVAKNVIGLALAMPDKSTDSH